MFDTKNLKIKKQHGKCIITKEDGTREVCLYYVSTFKKLYIVLNTTKKTQNYFFDHAMIVLCDGFIEFGCIPKEVVRLDVSGRDAISFLLSKRTDHYICSEIVAGVDTAMKISDVTIEDEDINIGFNTLCLIEKAKIEEEKKKKEEQMAQVREKIELFESIGES